MNLLIHDLSKEEFEIIASDYEGWEIISPDEGIRPCVGCFGCWIKSPGECVIKDGHDNMGELIHKAEEIAVISKYTYGGFSPFVKNIFDRSIGWVLPFFELVEGEMHHKKRYPEDKKVTFIFRGHDLSDEDKAAAEKYVKAVCRNFRSSIKEVRFMECEADEPVKSEAKKEPAQSNADKIILLNGSLRADNANTRKFLNYLSAKLKGDVEVINLSSYLNKPGELKEKLEGAGKLVLGMPLYVDGIPSAVLRVMEMMEKSGSASAKKVYVVVNMGLFESIQISNVLHMVKVWSEKCDFDYCGGVAIGAGEMVGQMLVPEKGGAGPSKRAGQALDKLSEVVNSGLKTEDIYADSSFPRALYMAAANMGWPMSAKQNGLKKKDIYRMINVI